MKKLLLILAIFLASCDKDDNQINLIELDLHITHGQLVNGFVSEENHRISSFEGAVSSISFKVYPHSGNRFESTSAIVIEGLPSYIKETRFQSQNGYVYFTLNITAPNENDRVVLVVSGRADSNIPVFGN